MGYSRVCGDQSMIKQFALALLLLTTCLIATQPAVQAKDLFSDACNQTSAADAAACKDKTDNNPLTGTNGTLIKIANIVSIIAGGAAVIILIISSLRYVISGGDSGKTQSAKEGIIGALVGLAIIVLARSLIGFVLSKL